MRERGRKLTFTELSIKTQLILSLLWGSKGMTGPSYAEIMKFLKDNMEGLIEGTSRLELELYSQGKTSDEIKAAVPDWHSVNLKANSTSVVSHHIDVLVKNGFVRRSRKGSERALELVGEIPVELVPILLYQDIS